MRWEIKASGCQHLRENVIRLLEAVYDYDAGRRTHENQREEAIKRLKAILSTLRWLEFIRPEDEQNFIYAASRTGDMYGRLVKKETYINRVMSMWRGDDRETPQVREKGEKPAGSEERH